MNWLAGRVPAQPTPATLSSRVPPDAEQYAYLLGLYLGDGHLVHTRRQVFRFTLALDAKYPGIVARAAGAMQEMVPRNVVRIYRHRHVRLFKVMSTSKAWPSLLPQHGPGRKHARLIELTDWQKAITHSEPEALIRGLIHSDGSRFIARQRVGDKVYEYSRYDFANRSEDIKGIFCEHLDLLGIGWTRPNAKLIAIDRRSEVAKLDAFIGPKR